MSFVKISCFLLAICFFYPTHLLANKESNLCTQEVTVLSCLKSHFEALYSQDYQRFWNILNAAAANAKKCDRLIDTVEFLELARLESNNAEFNEFFNEAIERLSTSKTNCFLDALVEADAQSRAVVLEKLRHPLFVERTTIGDALGKMTNNRKYKPIIDQYFDKNSSAR